MSTPAIVGLAITASLIVIVKDWRLSLAALVGQYVLVGLLLTRLIQPQVALTKVLVGALACVVLYLAARFVDVSERERETAGDSHSPPSAIGQGSPSLADFAFRFLVTLFMELAVYTLSKRHPLPEVPADIGLACYLLASLGLLVLMLTKEPMKVGMGLLTFIAGFELFYSVLERSLSMAGLLGIANLLIALAVAYLATSWEAGLPARKRGR